MGGGTHVLKVFWSELEFWRQNFQKRIVEANGGFEWARRGRLNALFTSFGPYGVVLAHAGHIGTDWHVGCKACNGIPHVVGGAMAVDAVMSVVGTGLGDAVVEAVLPGREVISASGHAMEAHA